MMIVLIALLLINFLVFLFTIEDERMKEVRERYKRLRDHLKTTGLFPQIHKEIPIVAHRGLVNVVGYNVNKGAEIGLCIDGTVNEIFHVLLHELAHCTVDEYSHSQHFWDQFKKLRDEAVSIGIYIIISERAPFCGKHIMDK